jgi:hypothetical protein
MPETILFGYCPASGAEPVTDKLADPRVAGRCMALSLVFDAVGRHVPAGQAGRVHQGRRRAPMRPVSFGPLTPNASTDQKLY